MKDTTRRFRLLVVLAPLIGIALGSFWLLEVMRRSADVDVPARMRTEPDFYVDRFSYVKVSPEGRPEYRFSGERMTHNPQDDTYDIRKPLFSSIAEGRSPTTLRAERAHVSNDNSEVHLYDNVHMDRPASGNSQELQVKSEYMLLLPDDDVVRSDKQVVITLGPSILTGTGMYANNAARELRLNSSVHGTYQRVKQ